MPPTSRASVRGPIRLSCAPEQPEQSSIPSPHERGMKGPYGTGGSMETPGFRTFLDEPINISNGLARRIHDAITTKGGLIRTETSAAIANGIAANAQAAKENGTTGTFAISQIIAEIGAQPLAIGVRRDIMATVTGIVTEFVTGGINNPAQKPSIPKAKTPDPESAAQTPSTLAEKNRPLASMEQFMWPIFADLHREVVLQRNGIQLDGVLSKSEEGEIIFTSTSGEVLMVLDSDKILIDLI